MMNELRLLLDESPLGAIEMTLKRKESRPEIEKALNDWREINSKKNGRGRQWCSFEAIQFRDELVVRLQMGTIHSNGEKEIAIKTRSYYFDPTDNKVKWIEMVHA